MGVIDTLADTLRSAAAGLAVSYVDRAGTTVSAPVKAYKWAPRDLDGSGPWAVVEVPTIERIGPDDRESQVGTKDWVIRFPVVWYAPLDDAYNAQALVVAALEAWTVAIDEDPTTDPTIDHVGIDSVDQPELIEDQARPLLALQTTVLIRKFVI